MRGILTVGLVFSPAWVTVLDNPIAALFALLLTYCCAASILKSIWGR